MTDLWAADHGEATGALVVLVHGSMDRSTSFARLVGYLPELHVRRYDRRGYGRSRPNGVTDLAGHVGDLLAVIGPDAAIVVGHSLGGVIALAAAERDARRVRSVLAFEPPMPWVDWWPESSAGSAAVTAAGADPGDAAERFMRRLLGDRNWDRLPPTTQQARRAEGPALVAEMVSTRTPPAPFDPARIAVPVVAAYGTDSAERHRRATAHIAEASGTVAEPIAGADHGAHRSHPAAFAALVRAAVGAASPA
ncbi:MAG: alpha/beta fold hydrolase [Acidimicrobiales bacterium]